MADKPGGFDAEDKAAIEAYADQAALLLRNARLYEELQKSYERLRDAQRNRDYFLQNVNHELRTPLTAILGWSEVLAEDRPDKETVKIAVDQINRSAQFLLALISDLLDLSRFEEGRTRLEPELVDLGPLVTGAVEPVSVMAEAKGIAMTVEAPSEPTPVRLDPMRMRQVLWNLVHNAVKFTPKGGRIRVEASADETGAVVLGRRQRRRRRREGPAVHLRALPPGGRLGDARVPRHGHRPRAREGLRRAPRGHDRRREPAGEGHVLPRADPADRVHGQFRRPAHDPVLRARIAPQAPGFPASARCAFAASACPRRSSMSARRPCARATPFRAQAFAGSAAATASRRARARR